MTPEKNKLHITKAGMEKLAAHGLKPEDVQIDGYEVVAPKPGKLPRKIRVTLYCHTDKETTYDKLTKQGMREGEALSRALFMGMEHEMLYEVNTETGDSTLLAVDGRELRQGMKP